MASTFPRARARDNGARLSRGGMRARLPARGHGSIAARPGDQAWFAIRPEKVGIALERPPDAATNCVAGEVWDIGYLGDFSVFIVKLADGRVIRAAQANVSRLVDRPITFGDMVWLNWKQDSGLVLTH